MCSCKKKQQLKLHDNVNLKLHFNGHLAFQQATRLVLQHFAAVIAMGQSKWADQNLDSFNIVRHVCTCKKKTENPLKPATAA